MRSDNAEIVERLRAARSLAWLRLVDDADLDTPAEVEPEPEAVVAPYQWLLDRIGDGVRLTQAGYLPPALVTEAMTALGWENEWPGKHNREDQTLPILDLRESAQRFGLLRKYRGQLLLTKTGRECLADPVALWWHLASRLPDARSEPERHAGVLYLLTVAAGRAMDEARLAEGLTILGWSQAGTYRSVSADTAFIAVRETWDLFRRLGLLGQRLGAREWSPGPQARRLARAALLGREASAPAVAPPPSTNRTAVQLNVQLRDIEPAIWRRVVVPASLTLRELHAVLQTAMGWQDAHLHSFEVDGVLYGDLEDVQGRALGDEDTFTVGQAAAVVPEFSYEYDFGDGWTHDIRVEQTVASVGLGTPHLTAGARACPPEDCGGPWGYQHLLEVLADPSHEEHAELADWLGGGFDPEAFDLAATNADLELYDRHTRQRRDRGM